MGKIRKEQQKSYIVSVGEMTHAGTNHGASTTDLDISTLSIIMPAAGDLLCHGSLFLQDLSAGTGDDIFYQLDLDTGAQVLGTGSFRSAGMYSGASCAVYAKFTGLLAGTHTLKIKMHSFIPHDIQWKAGMCHIGCFALINI